MKRGADWLPGRLLPLIFTGYCLLLGYGLFRPEPPPSLAVTNYDKLEHLLAFAVLGVGARALASERLAWPVWICVLLLAPLLEWLQGALQPARQFSFLDAAANLAGILLAMLSWYLLLRLKPHLRQRLTH